MGTDGANGLLKMRESGARTMAQDETTSVVFGMPRAAIALGAAEEVHSLNAMPQAILAACAPRNHANATCGAPRPQTPVLKVPYGIIPRL